jgi:hypothetical protein
VRSGEVRRGVGGAAAAAAARLIHPDIKSDERVEMGAEGERRCLGAGAGTTMGARLPVTRAPLRLIDFPRARTRVPFHWGSSAR